MRYRDNVALKRLRGASIESIRIEIYIHLEHCVNQEQDGLDYLEPVNHLSWSDFLSFGREMGSLDLRGIAPLPLTSRHIGVWSGPISRPYSSCICKILQRESGPHLLSSMAYRNIVV